MRSLLLIGYALSDPDVPMEGKYRVARGGSFSVGANILRSPTAVNVCLEIETTYYGFGCAACPELHPQR